MEYGKFRHHSTRMDHFFENKLEFFANDNAPIMYEVNKF